MWKGVKATHDEKWKDGRRQKRVQKVKADREVDKQVHRYAYTDSWISRSAEGKTN